MELRVRMLLLGVALLLPILALMIYQTWHYAQTKINDDKIDINHLVTLVTQRSELELSLHQKLLETLARTPAVSNPIDKTACQLMLASTVATNKSLHSLTLYSAEALPTCTSEKDQLPIVLDRGSFSEALRRKAPVISDHLYDKEIDKDLITISLPLLDRNKNVHSILVAELDILWLHETVEKLTSTPGTDIVVVDGNGMILIPKRWHEQSAREHLLFKDHSETSADSTFEGQGFDGIERIFISRSIYTTPSGPVNIWVSIPKTDARKLVVQEFLYQTLLTITAILLILGMIWRAGFLWIIHPIDKLRASAALLGKGQFATRTNLRHSSDEIGRLAASIDDMAGAIENSERGREMALEAAQLGAWDLDLASGNVIRTLRHDQIFGYATLQDEWSSETFFKHTYPEDRDYINACYADAFATGTHNLEVRMLRQDGEQRWIKVQGQVQYDEKKQPVRMIGVVGDITERKNAEAELKKMNRTLHLLSQCNEILVRATDEKELLESVCRQIVEIGGYRLAWVGFALPDQSRKVQPVAHYGPGEQYLENIQVTWSDDEFGRGPTGKSIREGKSIVAHDIQSDPGFTPWRAKAIKNGFAASISLPLKGKAEVIGALNIYAAEADAFHAEEINLLEKLADDLTFGMNHLREVSARETVERQLDYQSNYDDITGLPNRPLFIDRLNQSIVHAGRSGRLMAVFLIDLDRFKTINDSLGHSYGNQLLREMGQRLAKVLRNGDTVARLSVDEFGIVMSDMAAAEDILPLSHKILQTIAQPLTLKGQEVFVTGSAGISLFPKDGENAESLLQSAYSAMHSTKSMGGNSFQFYAREMNQSITMRLALDGAMRRALDHNEMMVHYQPKVCLVTGQMIGAEALARWPHPEMGMIPPVDFIPLAEETGLIVQVGEWVLNNVCQQIRTWLDAGLQVQPVAVNLSARQFRQENLVQTVRQVLTNHNIDASYLELEITESTAMKDMEKAVVTLKELKAIGCKLSLDDFGTGYSSLSYLKRFPIDHLKIDRAFVRDITSDPDDAAICTAVIGLAHNLKMKVIAEGVETEGQMTYLRQNQCDEIQGYFFSRPVPAAEFGQMMKDHKSLKLS